MNDVCGTCKTPENFPEDTKSELRPYGSGGSAICFRCAFQDEASEAQAKSNFGVLLDASGAISPVISIGTSAGPQPFINARQEHA